ncbi:MAG: DUF3987 domain-containing protein [Candidatus Obscuribacterales bacterium]|nr:DUF3987 domain-containing protein [Candidatus Obscuribacterales bacterium]
MRLPWYLLSFPYSLQRAQILELEHAARLAATLAFIDSPDGVEILPDHIHTAISLVQHYLNEAIRLFNVGAMDAELVKAQTLLDWLLKRRNR